MDMVHSRYISDDEKYSLVINYEEGDYGDPRSDDNCGIMACEHKDYILGDIKHHPFDHEDEEGDSETISDVAIVQLPVYLHDYGSSGISVSTCMDDYHPDDDWDSGQVGVIYITKERLKDIPAKLTSIKKLKEILSEEVKIYSTYMSGEVYWYSTYKRDTCSLDHIHEEQIDSGAGYLGDEGIKAILEDTIAKNWREVDE